MNVSWPLATWVAPVVPSLAFWLLLGSGLDGAGEGSAWTRLAIIGVVAMVAGAVTARIAGPRVSGIGVALCAGGAAVMVGAMTLVTR